MRTFQNEFMTSVVTEFYAAKILFMTGKEPSTIYGREFFVGYRTVSGRQAHIFKYPLSELRRVTDLPYKERVRAFNTGEHQALLVLFDNAMDGPETAYQSLLDAQPYWCECADCYLVAGFGLTADDACRSLEKFFLARA